MSTANLEYTDNVAERIIHLMSDQALENNGVPTIAHHKFKIDLFNIHAKALHYTFHKLFDVIPADTPTLLEEAHRVRYQVFCLEHKNYEDPADHPDGLERDRYDSHSSHALVIHRKSGQAIGTVRVILPNEYDLMNSFPLQQLCDHPSLKDPNHIRNACEISRMAIKREFQMDMIRSCKKNFRSLFKYDEKYNLGVLDKMLMCSGVHLAPMGLVRGMFMQALLNGRTEGFGIMEPRFIKTLQHIGFVMEPIGSEIDYHGKRVPFKFNISDIFNHAMQANQSTWNVVTGKGQLHELAHYVDRRQSRDRRSQHIAVTNDRRSGARRTDNG